MKTVKTIKVAMLSLGFLATTGLFSMFDLGKLNLNETFKKAKQFTDQIIISSDPKTTQESIIAATRVTLQSLPNEILGVNIEQLKRGQIDTSILLDVQMAIREAANSLPSVIAFLEFSDVTIPLLKSIVYPRLEKILSQHAMGQQALAVMRSVLDFAEKNPAVVKNLSQRLAGLLTALHAGLQNLAGKDLATMNPMQIAEAFSALKAQFEQQYQAAYPIIVEFINNNRDALQNILNQIASMNLTFDLQQLLQQVQNELKRQGLGSVLGF